MTLNHAQQEAVDANYERIAIVAGAGTGKTATLTHIIAKDLKERGISPSSMCAITFTRNASVELKDRLVTTCGNASKEITACTIHSMCLHIVEKHLSYLELGFDSFTLFDGDDQMAVVKWVLEMMDSKEKPDVVVAHMKSGAPYPHKIFPVICQYREMLKEFEAVDLDMLLEYALQLIEMGFKTFDALYVDEFQDTNDKQLEVLKAINPSRLVVIGDPDQSIYEWNGAKPDNMVYIEDIFAGIKVYYLTENYRCTRPIIKASNQLISNNKNRLEKALVAHKDGEDVQVAKCDDERDEARHIASKIDEMKLSDISIICRTNRRAGLIGADLERRGMPVEYYTKDADPYAQGDNPRIIALMRACVNPKDLISLVTALKYLRPDLAGDISEALRIAVMTGNDILDSIYDSELRDAIMGIREHQKRAKEQMATFMYSDILDRFGIVAKYIETGRVNKVQDTRKLGKAMRDWMDSEHRRGGQLSLEAFVKYIVIRSILKDRVGAKSEAIKIGTVHSMKGLEFKNVFVAGLSGDEFPSSRGIMEEERRLMYVAMTRAIDKLFISYPAQKEYRNGYTKNVYPSIFLEELKKEELV